MADCSKDCTNCAHGDSDRNCTNCWGLDDEGEPCGPHWWGPKECLKVWDEKSLENEQV